MTTLTFEKLSQFDRAAEPVTVSIPFAQGTLTDPDHFTVTDDGTPLPLQYRILAQWPDGSVKWLLVHLQPDLPGNRAKRLHFAVESDAVPPLPTQRCVVTEEDDNLLIDTGPLMFRVGKRGFAPLSDISLLGRTLWPEETLSGFNLRFGDQEVTSLEAPVEVEIIEAGPLRVEVEVRGMHRMARGETGAESAIALRGRVVVYAGKPYIHVEHQFIHMGDEAELTLDEYTLRFQPQATGTPKTALGQGFYRTTIEEGDAVEMALTAELLLYQANEHFIDSFYGDFWSDWRDDNSGLTLSIYQAHQHFPKGLKADASGIICELVPVDADPIRILQGMGKTHRLQLHFHDGQRPLTECSTRSLQFQLPDRPALDRAWYAANNPWRENFFPPQLPNRLFTFFNSLHDGRPKALGMMHFGDAPDAHYSNQGRGQGESVWVNNEYDRPHACTLYYGLTGQRRVLDSAIVGARHWIDVDLCHHHPDPLVNGGLKLHTAYHGTGRVTPSHEWTEGFLDYYFLTGNREGLEGAISVAENIMRHMQRPEMNQPGATAVREGGWALRAMVGMLLGTSDERWRVEAKRSVENFLAWHAEYGALLAPYTSHTMPRVPFMISLTVNSFARYLLIEKDERIERLIVDVMDDLIEHCIGPDGLFFYKELPSLQRSAPTPHALEALTYAYRITGNLAYMRIAVRHFAALTANPVDGAGGVKRIDPSGAVVAGNGGARIFADKYTSLLIFAAEAAPLGLLDWYGYPDYPTSKGHLFQ
ncbi:MAG: hypothetical protein R2867_38930 [Caldilineaceae bacterium]